MYEISSDQLVRGDFLLGERQAADMRPGRQLAAIG